MEILSLFVRMDTESDVFVSSARARALDPRLSFCLKRLQRELLFLSLLPSSPRFLIFPQVLGEEVGQVDKAPLPKTSFWKLKGVEWRLEDVRWIEKYRNKKKD